MESLAMQILRTCTFAGFSKLPCRETFRLPLFADSIMHQLLIQIRSLVALFRNGCNFHSEVETSIGTDGHFTTTPLSPSAKSLTSTKIHKTSSQSILTKGRNARGGFFSGIIWVHCSRLQQSRYRVVIEDWMIPLLRTPQQKCAMLINGPNNLQKLPHLMEWSRTNHPPFRGCHRWAMNYYGQSTYQPWNLQGGLKITSTISRQIMLNVCQ